MPDESTEHEKKLFDQLFDQTLLLEQDISQAINEQFSLNEFGPTDSRKAWFVHSIVRNTAALFRQELLDLTRRRFPWATSVELELSFSQEEPYQYVYMCLSPLPPLP
ncbi:hypothetical protein [Hymenobacter sp. UYCo722]|uniref:hypothetical protein n=1 Tax=Hymenobacter sp. UYCo722 TaxID=3156335 RepID=UPI0033927923